MIRKTALAVIAIPLFTIGVHTIPADAGEGHRNWSRCHYEDGSGQKRCIWDAKHMGNGIGQSGKIINGGEDDMRWVPLTHRKAHHLIHAH